MSDRTRVLGAEDYARSPRPYEVQRVAEAFLEELRRRREPKAEGPQAEDPQVLKSRAEAAELKAKAAKSLKEAEVKAAALLEEARERGAREAAEARQKAKEEGHSEGRAEGLADGQARGREEGKAAYAERLAALERLLEGIRDEKSAYFADRESLLVELALRVAAKVIHREVATRPDHIQNLLRQTAQMLADQSKLQVFVHPGDLERLSQAQADGLLNLKRLKSIEFLADDKIVAGGLRVASGYQTLDATLDSQLAEICRGLLEEAGHERD